MLFFCLNFSMSYSELFIMAYKSLIIMAYKSLYDLSPNNSQVSFPNISLLVHSALVTRASILLLEPIKFVVTLYKK